MQPVRFIALAAALAAGAPALADEGAAPPITRPFDGSFEDAAFAVENAILNRGLVVDWVSHVGEMLNRTAAEVGGEEIFAAADVFMFCSAVVSRQVMEADPMNLQHCPYGIFVAEREGEVLIGHRDYPEGPMQAVEDLLSEIAAEAAGG